MDIIPRRAQYPQNPVSIAEKTWASQIPYILNFFNEQTISWLNSLKTEFEVFDSGASEENISAILRFEENPKPHYVISVRGSPKRGISSLIHELGHLIHMGQITGVQEKKIGNEIQERVFTESPFYDNILEIVRQYGWTEAQSNKDVTEQTKEIIWSILEGCNGNYYTIVRTRENHEFLDYIARNYALNNERIYDIMAQNTGDPLTDGMEMWARSFEVFFNPRRYLFLQEHESLYCAFLTDILGQSPFYISGLNPKFRAFIGFIGDYGLLPDPDQTIYPLFGLDEKVYLEILGLFFPGDQGESNLGRVKSPQETEDYRERINHAQNIFLQYCFDIQVEEDKYVQESLRGGEKHSL